VASIQISGNCNFAYVTYLNGYTAEASMKSVLTVPAGYSYSVTGELRPPTYRNPTCGMYLFAQGSDDPVATNPYAPKFKEYIEKHELGKVIEHPPVPNPMHSGKPGILFVWIIDHTACYNWFMEHVLKPWQKQNDNKSKAKTVK